MEQIGIFGKHHDNGVLENEELQAAEAQLCRIVALEGGEFGIRANMLNPDAIFDGSQFWTAEMREMRAKAYGVDASKLPDYYRNRTLLKTEVC